MLHCMHIMLCSIIIMLSGIIILYSQGRSLIAAYPHPSSLTPFQQACHFDVLRPSAMNLHNGHALEV
jgi:hypothetical protein